MVRRVVDGVWSGRVVVDVHGAAFDEAPGGVTEPGTAGAEEGVSVDTAPVVLGAVEGLGVRRNGDQAETGV